MFSLWVCPDCRVVGKRIAVKPVISYGLTVDKKSLTFREGQEQEHRPGCGYRRTPVMLSEWTCTSCGQIGCMVEHREPVNRQPETVIQQIERLTEFDPESARYRSRSDQIIETAFTGAFLVFVGTVAWAMFLQI